mgnify:CR=1 FL=1
MFKTVITAIVMAAFVAVAAGNADTVSNTEDRAASSRAAVKQFFGALKGELEAGIKAGGPTNAIGICRKQAPAIAHKVSTQMGWKVARTSLKVRNPNNQPDVWERSVLEEFDARKAKGEDPAKMEHFAVVEMDNKKVFRYMKAIPTAPKPCLACHGDKVAPEVEAKLAELYPGDLARGYKAGDIRGAFTIIQPME